ncbi:MAG: uracil phosphoribosyltransferase [Legionellales bacterium]|nr:uracil phosphoribosyltransferase [Legionellales bacterium]|tara:strand:- start:549 stop:1178 length:630 start_codon:yes stop_codon:yes gene_type:complete
MENFIQIPHPLIAHKLTLLRSAKTPKKDFKKLVEEIGMLLAYEVTKDFPLTTQHIETPLCSIQSPVLAGKKPVILPILRAGIGMVDGFLNLMPSARVGHIGLFRDEQTLKPHLYYFKIPQDSEDRDFIICDPMLATGGSAIAAVDILKKHNIQRITFVCLVAAPEGISAFNKNHPEVKIYAASLDEKLNSDGYILPGLGDAGDRLFGTK